MWPRHHRAPLATLLLGALASPAAAQSPAGSAVGDKAALLAVAADPGNADAKFDAFIGWDVGAGPCAAGSWNAYNLLGGGYKQVKCDCEGGRVVYVNNNNADLGGDVALFAPLGALELLDLHLNAALHGDVASLGGLAELRQLRLDRTAVHGAPASLGGLRHLGEEYTMGLSSVLPRTLSLADTRVAGPVAALRALPGLGSGWGSGDMNCGRNYDASCHFSSCDGFPAASCAAAGLAVVADAAANVAANDECGCCAGSPMVRNETTGACCPDCGTHGSCDVDGQTCRCELENDYSGDTLLTYFTGAHCETLAFGEFSAPSTDAVLPSFFAS